MKRVAIVTGASRGLGKAVAISLLESDFVVCALGRSSPDDLIAAYSSSSQLSSWEVDLRDLTAVESCFSELMSNHGRVDVLVNNAGVYLERSHYEKSGTLAEVPISIFTETQAVNLLAPLRLCQLVLPTMKKQNYGRIVNVSSGMGRYFELDRRAPAYRLSKAALNALTRIAADEVADYDILVNAVCPGWVRTDMGGPNAVRSIEEGARGIVYAALLPEDGPRGCLLRDGENFGW